MARKIRISATAWPWGRSSPRQRVRDLERMIERNTAQIRIVEDQAREALRRIELNNVALQEQMRIAEEFIVEEARSENKRLAYELAEYGIDRIAEVDGIEDQIDFGEQLRKQLAEAKNGSGNGNKDMESFLNSMET